MLKNKNNLIKLIFFVLIAITFIMPSFAEEQINIETIETVKTVQPVDGLEQYSNNNADDQILTEPPKNQMQSPYKQPMNKKLIIKKFLLAMLGVVGSSLLIFAVLSIYNRVRYNYLNSTEQQIQTSESDCTLDTPTTLTEAVKIFLEKTKWD